MIIQVGDIYCKVTEPKKYLQALAIIRGFCKARPDGFQYMPKYKAGFWDGYVSIMPSLSEFPTGLLDQILDALKSDGYNPFLQYGFPARDWFPVGSGALKGVELRDYQIEAANTLLTCKRGVGGMATNAGKTLVMAAIAWALGNKDILILEARKELLYQTAKRLEEWLGVSVGIVGDGKWDVKPITVAMVQTLSRHADLPDFRANVCVMVDECHHTSSNTYIDVLAHIPGSYRFGFSGTPLKYDTLLDLKLIGYTGPIRYKISNEYLITAGYSAKPIINLLEVQTDNDDLWGAEYSDAYAYLVAENSERNKAIAELVLDQHGITLILVGHIKHGELLRDAIPNSVLVMGKDDTNYRQGVLDTMRAAKHGVFIATPIFDEGIDVPAVDRIVIAGGGKSPVKLLQRIGRGMRKKDHNNLLTVIDFIDLGNKHLLNHAEARLDVYKQEGFRVVKRPGIVTSKASNGYVLRKGSR